MDQLFGGRNAAAAAQLDTGGAAAVKHWDSFEVEAQNYLQIGMKPVLFRRTTNFALPKNHHTLLLLHQKDMGRKLS